MKKVLKVLLSFVLVFGVLIAGEYFNDTFFAGVICGIIIVNINRLIFERSCELPE